VKSFVLSLTVLMLLAACENSAEPLNGFLGSGGGGSLTQTQASGNWSFTLTKTTTLACTGALADQVITAHLDVQTDGTLSGTTSSWQNPLTTAAEPLTGSVILSTGITDLIFRDPAVASNAAMELRGTMTATGSLTGTLTDPAPGFTQVFGTDGCQYSVTGNKTS
jgi:hypothetical protein